MLVGEGDVKATDFLTSLGCPSPPLQPLHLGSQGWGRREREWGRARESGGGGSAPSPHKIQVPPATFLA